MMVYTNTMRHLASSLAIVFFAIWIVGNFSGCGQRSGAPSGSSVEESRQGISFVARLSWPKDKLALSTNLGLGDQAKAVLQEPLDAKINGDSIHVSPSYLQQQSDLNRIAIIALDQEHCALFVKCFPDGDGKVFYQFVGQGAAPILLTQSQVKSLGSVLVCTAEGTGSQVFCDGQIEIHGALKSFGLCTRGQHLTHAFQVKNMGEESIRIGGIQATCQCVSASGPAALTELPAGSSEEFEVKMISSGTKAFSESALLTFFNKDSSTPFHASVRMMGNCLKTFELSERRLKFSDCNAKGECSREILISAPESVLEGYSNSGLEVSDPKDATVVISASIRQGTQSQHRAVLSVSVQSQPGFADRTIQATVQVRNSVDPSYNFAVPLSVRPSVLAKALPSVLLLESTEGDAFTGSLAVITSSPDVEIVSVDLANMQDAMKLEVKKPSKNRWELFLTVSDNEREHLRGATEFAIELRDHGNPERLRLKGVISTPISLVTQ